MKHQTYSWKSARGKNIFGQSWITDSTPKAIICLVHGQGEHSSRYDHVANFFVQHDIAFFTGDLIGHGMSEGARGHVSSFSEYIENAEMILQEAKKTFPDTPIFIYGHSMGGNIAINHAMQTHDENIKGYIVTSPWIKLSFEPPPWKVVLGKTVKSIIPSLQQPTGLDAATISHDLAEVKKYREDKLNHSKISVSAYFEILTHGENILLNADKLSYPMLLMHGSGDKLTSHLASREFAAMRKDLITYKEFEGLYHELQHEFERQNIFDTILHWINEQLKK
ncbi:MAG: lysophospholipase [Fimbriimonadaceae bacterium]|nr:lysophospholipase [Chitinophagales bacterium]